MNIQKLFITLLLSFIVSSLSYADNERFDSDKMIVEIEEQMNLSRKKLDELKPVLDTKSRELQESINESIEKGYLEMQSLSKKLEQASKDAEKQLNDILESDEIRELHAYLESIDKEAIAEIEDRLAEALSELLELTEDQVSKIQPMLEDGFQELGKMLEQLVEQSERDLEDFQKRFNDLNEGLKKQLEDSLDEKQIRELDEHRDELQEKIRVELFTA